MIVRGSQPVRLLIAEDDVATRTLLTVFFQKKGFDVTAVNDGRSAALALGAGCFDVAIFDVMMPEMTGLEALERVRAAGIMTPVILATALSDAQDVVRGLGAGADDYVAKPFDLAVLHARVMLRLRTQPPIAAAAVVDPSPLRVGNPNVARGMILDGRYELEEIIGSGSFGVVWRARHLGLETAVAVKLLRREQAGSGTNRLEPIDSMGRGADRDSFEERTDELRLEGVRAARVPHQNAVRIHDVGTMPDGTAYLVMELLDGPTLEHLLRRERVMTIARAVGILLPVLDVLAAAHAQGVIHRDIKPANILVHRTAGGDNVVKVLDFGVAKLIDAGRENPGGAPGTGPGSNSNRTIAGSPAYLAPERLRGHKYDGRTDVYGAGIVLYEMLTGRVPFQSLEGDLMAVALMHLKEQALPPSKRNPLLPAGIDALVLQFLEKDPARRPTAEAAVELAQDMLDLTAPL
ncbi:MAG: protein kinase [Deltaproteobacteria bacterium]|nr:protein kinase [Deltaproteobacteria bacterium]